MFCTIKSGTGYLGIKTAILKLPTEFEFLI